MSNRWLVLVGVLGLACVEEDGRTRDEMTGAGSVVPGPVSDNDAPDTATPSMARNAASVGDGVGGATGGLTLIDVGNISGLVLGDPLELVAGTGMVPYAIGPNPYGIQGSGFLARSRLGNAITIGTDPGKICIRGNLEEVPLNPDGHGDYGQYWGVELGFNLNEAPASGENVSAPPADERDADAGALNVALPWHPGTVVGFSFVIEGPTIDLIRFKALPDGVDSSLEANVYCKELHATSGAANSILLGELSTYCWSGTSSILPISGGLDNISWQLPADVAPVGARPFDWCLSALRPILTQP